MFLSTSALSITALCPEQFIGAIHKVNNLDEKFHKL